MVSEAALPIRVLRHAPIFIGCDYVRPTPPNPHTLPALGHSLLCSAHPCLSELWRELAFPHEQALLGLLCDSMTRTSFLTQEFMIKQGDVVRECDTQSPIHRFTLIGDQIHIGFAIGFLILLTLSFVPMRIAEKRSPNT